MRLRRLIVFVFAAWCVGACAAAAQEQAAGARELTADEARLVAGSRAAIIASGLSPEFFAAHFRLERVFAKPADRRVVWRLRVAEYEATLNDAVGSYTDEKGVRHDSHSIAGRLPEAHDIVRTLPRERAVKLMKKCIGAHGDEVVVYEAFGAPPRAALSMIAVSLPEPPKPAAPTSAPAPPPARPDSDVIRLGGKKPLPPRIGRIDLETGRCTVGVGQSGSPHPDADKYARPRR